MRLHRAVIPRIAALLGSAAVQWWISPPTGWTALHLVSWVPAFWVFSQCSGRRALLAGWTTGFFANLILFSWLVETVRRFGSLPTPLAVAVLVIFAAYAGLGPAIFAWGFRAVRRTAGAAWPFAIAAWFCAVEYAMPQVFSYLQGVGWYQVPRIFLLSALTGVSGVSFLLILVNAVTLLGLETSFGSPQPGNRRRLLANAAGLLGLVLFTVGYSSLRMAEIGRVESATRTLRAALVQPLYTIEKRRAMRRQGRRTLAEDLVAMSREADRSRPDSAPIDVFVWPESALSGSPADPDNAVVREFVKESGAEVWTGALTSEEAEGGSRRNHNSAFRVFGDGRTDRRYDKNILVPFGEYVPLRDVVPGFDRIRIPARIEPGSEARPYATGRASFAFLICYEAIRTPYVRRSIREGADLLVNVTVDAWFGDTLEPHQHLMLAAAQSAQFGTPMLRATTTGISAAVDARGVITAKSGSYTREVVFADVKPVRIPSPYARWGDWFAWLCVAASALLGVRSRAARHRANGPPAAP